jgi:protein ImuB
LAARCRIGCVRIGRFAIGALHRAPTGEPSARRGSSAADAAPGGDDAPSGQALVAVADLKGKPRVVATSREAARRGVAAGMALAEAKALAADLVALPWDDERIARAALETVTALLAASPRVAWAGRRTDAQTHGRTDARTHEEGVWWVDAAGLGSEAKLAQKLAVIAGGLGYGPARAGIADSAIAAYAATFGRARAQGPGDTGTPANGRATAPARGRTHARARRSPVAHFRIVPSGADAGFLAPFPIALLDLHDDLAETLHSLGITTLGQLAALEADEVEARFGPEGLAAHRLARGIDARGPTTPRDDALPVVEIELGGPVATAEPLLFVLKGSLVSLGEALRARGLAAREITFALRLDDGGTAVRAVRPARPTSHPDALFDHCRIALETWQLPEPATGLALSAAVTVPAAGEQGDLLAPRWADPAALAAAFDRIRGSEGPDAVAVPEVRDAHLPQDGGAWTRGDAHTQAHLRTDARKRGAADPTARGRTATPVTALRLLSTAVPVHVRLGRAGLAAFKHEGAWHDITEWCGPERLAPRWWECDPAGASGRAPEPRDYYTAKTTEGTLWLLFRTAASQQWLLAGWLD